MEVVATLKTRCPACLSGVNLQVWVGRDFEGVVVACRACGYEDYIGNPFADFQMFLGLPQNWHFIHTGKSRLMGGR